MQESTVKFPPSPPLGRKAGLDEELDPASRKIDWTLQEGRQVVDLPWQAQVSLFLLVCIFTAIGAVYFWAVSSSSDSKYAWLAPLMTGLWIIAGIGVLGLMYWLWREFARFGNELSSWAIHLSKGDLTARMKLRGRNCPSRKIREQINAITDDYQALARVQQQRLSRQERYIQEKKRHLSVLYEVASCISRAENLDDLLNRFLHTLKDVVGAEAATVRLLDKSNTMRLVASVGIDPEAVRLEETLPAPGCVCGTALNDQKLQIQPDVSRCARILGTRLCDKDQEMEMLAIPLQYRDRVLGIYNLFVSYEKNSTLEDEYELLISIGRHLGMAIEKAGNDEDIRTLSIMEERTRMAHELHDSLAQTLASLRFKVRLLDDTFNQGDEVAMWQELEALENTIDEAYAELRSLITHFRAPLDGKGVVRVVERLSERFRQETGLEVFFYHNWHLQDLDRETELEVVRIVQESLNNVRKHSRASTVRILMYSSEEGRCSILIEDDGVGLPNPLPEPNPTTGEHIGLRIMRERAGKISGEIQFESEPCEGTLIQLDFDAPPARKFSALAK